ncbi:MAG: hypothetical protein ACKUBY_05015 [Candidatus Moraniibacteriota bacterium]
MSKILYGTGVLCIGVFFFMSPAHAGCQPGSQVFEYSGINQNFTVPTGCDSIQIKAWGGGGAGEDPWASSSCPSGTGYPGGGAGYATGTFNVIPGSAFTVIVAGGGHDGGAGGFGGGGSGRAGGGGRSGIIRNSDSTEIITAGGGGAGGTKAEDGTCFNKCSGAGGAGGGLIGSAGAGCDGGAGGTQSSGAGQFIGGDGDGGGGGGGAGWYGGYAGLYNNGNVRSGGGGSSHVDPAADDIVIEGGSGITPANTSDSDYQIGIGVGGSVGLPGNEGRLVIYYSGPMDIVINNPDSSQLNDAVNDSYISVDNGTIDSTTQITASAQVTFQSNTTNAIFPNNTVITEALNGNFNFENFITQNTLNEERGDHPNAVGAVRLGIPNENLTFSNDITMEITVSEAYNDMELEVLSQLEGEVTWNTHTTCTVTNGICTFTTNHATTYIVNGDGTISGIDDLNLNVEVNATLSMDCYDKDGSTGDYDVILGTVANPGIVIAGTPAVGQSTCIVTTNDTQGYYLSMINDNGASNTTLVHSNNTDEIPDLTQFDQTTKVTESWNAPTTKGLGFSVIQFPQNDTTHNTFNNIWTTSGDLCEEGTTNDDAEYAGVPQTAQAIAAYTAYNSTSSTTDVCYKVDVSPSQPSGVYTGSVTYTATSDASGYWQ